MGSPSYWTKVKVSAKPATCLLEVLRQNPFSCLFQLLESVPSLHSWPWITCSFYFFGHLITFSESPASHFLS